MFAAGLNSSKCAAWDFLRLNGMNAEGGVNPVTVEFGPNGSAESSYRPPDQSEGEGAVTPEFARVRAWLTVFSECGKSMCACEVMSLKLAKICRVGAQHAADPTKNVISRRAPISTS